MGACPPGWIEATENGWGAVAAWFAGIENLVREPRSYKGRTTQVTYVVSDGTEESRSEAFAAADMESVDNDIDSFLADAGVPLQPHGFTWLWALHFTGVMQVGALPGSVRAGTFEAGWVPCCVGWHRRRFVWAWAPDQFPVSHRVVADGELQPVEHLLRRVTLLRRATRILRQPAHDHIREPLKDPRPRPRRRRRRQPRREILQPRVLDHRIPTHTEPTSDLTPRHTLPVESPDIFYNAHGYRHLFPVPSRRNTVRKIEAPDETYLTVAGPWPPVTRQPQAPKPPG